MCVCVCERERERDGERGGKRERGWEKREDALSGVSVSVG